MTRVKGGIVTKKRRKRTLKETKGFNWGRNSKFKLAKDALRHALTHAFQDRRKKKRVFRTVWQVQIGAACKQYDLSYSKFIHGLTKSKIEINRKMLAKLAIDHPEIFKIIVEKAKATLETLKTA